MMQFIQKNKVLLGILAAVFVAIVVYLNFFSGSGSVALLSTTEDTQSPVSRDLLLTLSNLHTIKLDSAIFTDPVFQSLTNFGVQIPPENVGRRNPFEALPK